MKSEKLRAWMRHPEKIGAADLRELEELVSHYPYFQSARILYLKALHLQGGARFRNELKSSTIHLIDHKQLFRYLNNQVVFTEQSIATRSELAELVDERIRELDGHLVVTTQGIPAFPSAAEESFSPQRDEEITMDFTADLSTIPVVKTNRPVSPQKKVEDQKVISNPVMLEGIPGLIDDYSERSDTLSTPQQKVLRSIPEPKQEIQANSIPDLSSIPGMLEDVALAQSQTVAPTSFAMSLDMDMAQETPPSTFKARPILKESPDTEEKGERKRRRRKEEIIEQFIQSDPVMPKLNEATEIRDLTKGNPYGEEDLFSETLAKIYIKQQLYDKAITTYIKLSLKYPEKSIYFADRIEHIKENIK